MPILTGRCQVSLPIETVEGVWDPIAAEDNWTPLNSLVSDIQEWGARLAGESRVTAVESGP